MTEKWVRLELASQYRDGEKLVTFEIKAPKFLVAQINTHRQISKNSASSRAIPFTKHLTEDEQVFLPPVLTRNQKGMAGGELLSENDRVDVSNMLYSLCIDTQNKLNVINNKYNIHKQHISRYLEPFLYTRIIGTANERWWHDVVRQRNNKHTQPEFEKIAAEIEVILKDGELNDKTYRTTSSTYWHTPFLSPDEREVVAAQLPTRIFSRPDPFYIDKGDPICQSHWNAISAARCARVSYLNHDGKRDYQSDVDLFKRLLSDGHLSPFEHVARPLMEYDSGVYFRPFFGLMDNNFIGWRQLRSELKGE